MANSLNLNSADRKIFNNLSMMAYISKIQKKKFLEFDHSGQGRKTKLHEYFHPAVGYLIQNKIKNY